MASPTPPRTVYQLNHSFASRARRAAELQNLNSGNVPLICEPDTNLLASHTSSSMPNDAPGLRPAPTTSTVRPSFHVTTTTTTTATPRTTRTTTFNRQPCLSTPSRGAGPSAGPPPQTIASARTPAHRQLILPLVLHRSTLISDVMVILRRHLVLDPSKAIFLVVGEEGHVLPVSAKSVGDVYDAHKDADGYLYVLYTIESTYG